MSREVRDRGTRMRLMERIRKLIPETYDLACNFSKCSPIVETLSLADSEINL